MMALYMLRETTMHGLPTQHRRGRSGEAPKVRGCGSACGLTSGCLVSFADAGLPPREYASERGAGCRRNCPGPGQAEPSHAGNLSAWLASLLGNPNVTNLFLVGIRVWGKVGRGSGSGAGSVRVVGERWSQHNPLWLGKACESRIAPVSIPQKGLAGTKRVLDGRGSLCL